MQEAVNSLTLNNSRRDIFRHPVIAALNNIGEFDFNLQKKHHRDYVLSMSYECASKFFSSVDRAQGDFDTVDEAFISNIMDYYRNVD